MALDVRTFPGGPLATNAYLVIAENGAALVIDAPQDVTQPIMAAAKEAGATIEQIVITHPHWDHIGDAATLREQTGAPLAAHPRATDGLAKPGSAVMELPAPIPPVTPDRLLDEGDTVTLGRHTFEVLYLPGHEPSHIALYSEPDRVLLSGDVLFPGGHGRVDIPGSDPATMRDTLARLVDLPADVTVYPGHGAPTTIGAERWLQETHG
jgi:glyoxylase-like metal-dependent hydrolase (beta-lactamase superfamily II)